MGQGLSNATLQSTTSEVLAVLFAGTGKTLGTAESCTGGGIGAAIVAAKGASEYFRGAVIAYCDEVKEQLLGVKRSTLRAQTAVCEDVAIQMAQGALRLLAVDYALAVTGLAGPTGGSDAIPVGTIWLCCASHERHRTLCLTGDEGRATNIDNAITEGLRLLFSFLREERQEGRLTIKIY